MILKYLSYIIIVILFQEGIFSQANWEWKNPYPQGNLLNDIYSFSTRGIVAVGDNCTILETTDGGDAWKVYSELKNVKATLRAVSLIKSNLIIAVGDSGYIIKKIFGKDEIISMQIEPKFRFNDVFFVDNDLGFAVGDSGNLFRSTNGGESWNKIYISRVVNLNKIHFPSKNIGYIVGNIGTLLKTTNSGITWDTLSAGTKANLNSVFFFDDTTGWIGGFQGLSKTINGGKSWITQNRIYIVNDLYFTTINNGFASTMGRILLKTTNSGANWIVDTLDVDEVLRSISFYDRINGWMLGRISNIYRTENSGVDWNLINYGSLKNFYDGVFLDNQIGFAIGENGELMKTINKGEGWSIVNTGIKSILYSIAVNKIYNTSTICAVGERGIIIRSVDRGNNWTNILSPTNRDLKSVFSIGQNFWAVGDKGTVLKSIDDGWTWLKQNFSDTTDLNAVFFIDENIGWAVGKLGLIYKTYDGGLSWQKIQSLFKNELHDVFFVNEKVGWFVGSNKTILRTDCGGECLSNDSIAIASIQMSPPRKVDYYSVKFINDSVGLIAGSSGIVIKTTNAGRKWFVSKTLTSNNIYDIEILNNEEAVVFGSVGTILKTYNLGGTEPPPPPPPPVEIPKPKLYQNYPNPFNEITYIGFELFEPLRVQIKVYDLLGRYIETLTDSEFDEGYHEVEFSSINKSTGVYFYHFITPSYKKANAMFLIK